jgi:ribose 5-phosphate isomerase A
VARGLGIRGVPTSGRRRAKARAAGIPLVGLDQVEEVDLTIDGADEINREGSAIKGAAARSCAKRWWQP